MTKNCFSCETPVSYEQHKTVNPCDPVQKPAKNYSSCCVYKCKPKKICIPECRKTIKDKNRVKPCPPCKCICPPKKCIRKTKCKFYSVKDKCRQNKSCPPVKCCYEVDCHY